jgi:hypothetical protein
MNLARPSAPRAADRFFKSPLFEPLAERWALTWLLSIESSSGILPPHGGETASHDIRRTAAQVPKLRAELAAQFRSLGVLHEHAFDDVSALIGGAIEGVRVAPRGGGGNGGSDFPML